jgi:hypothetical protein
LNYTRRRAPIVQPLEIRVAVSGHSVGRTALLPGTGYEYRFTSADLAVLS